MIPFIVIVFIFVFCPGLFASPQIILPTTPYAQKINDVLNEMSLQYALLDTILCQRTLHDGLMNDLILAAKIANVLENRRYEIECADSAYTATDNRGLAGIFWLTHLAADKQDTCLSRWIYYGEGRFDRRYVLEVNGRAIVDIMVRDLDERRIIRDMHLYLRIDNGTIGFLSKVPVLGRLIRKFAISKSLSFAQLSRDIAYKLNRNPQKSLTILKSRLAPNDYHKLLQLMNVK